MGPFSTSASAKDRIKLCERNEFPTTLATTKQRTAKKNRVEEEAAISNFLMIYETIMSSPEGFL